MNSNQQLIAFYPSFLIQVVFFAQKNRREHWDHFVAFPISVNPLFNHNQRCARTAFLFYGLSPLHSREAGEKAAKWKKPQRLHSMDPGCKTTWRTQGKMEHTQGCLILQKKGLSSGTGQAKVIRSLITTNFLSTYFKRNMQALCQSRQSPFQHFSAIFQGWEHFISNS